MRLLIIHPLDISYSSYQYINALIRALQAFDIETTILAPHESSSRLPLGESSAFQLIPLRYDGPFLSRETKKAINAFDPEIVHVWNPREMTARAALETVIGTGARLVVNYEDPEHFHLDTLQGPANSSRILRHVDKAFVTAQDIEAFAKELNWHWVTKDWQTPPRPGQFIHPVFFAALNHLASGFTGIWHPWVHLLSERFRKPTLLMPYSVDFATRPLPVKGDTQSLRAKLNVPQDATIFLRTGMIYAIVNDQETLFAAFAKHLKQRPNDVLILCGSDGDSKLSNALIKKYGLSDQIRRLGFLNEEEYKALLNAADVFLCPGYPDDYNRYRLAMKIIEYMILGKPMICYASGIGEDMIHGRDALLLDEYTPERFAELMLQMATDPALRQALGQNARARAKEWFNVHTLAPRVAEFYQGLLHAPPPPTQGKPYAPDALPRALLKKLPILLEKGAKRIALYGAGKHTQRLLKYTRLEPLELVCIVDDVLSIEQIEGLPIISPNQLHKYHVDVLLISSDSNEEAMAQNAKVWLPDGIQLEKLYGQACIS